MASRASSILLLFLILDKSLAWDGCNLQAWRYGDNCIHDYMEEVMCLGDTELSANVETQPSTTGMRCGAATTHLAAEEESLRLLTRPTFGAVRRTKKAG